MNAVLETREVRLVLSILRRDEAAREAARQEPAGRTTPTAADEINWACRHCLNFRQNAAANELDPGRCCQGDRGPAVPACYDEAPVVVDAAPEPHHDHPQPEPETIGDWAWFEMIDGNRWRKMSADAVPGAPAGLLRLGAAVDGRTGDLEVPPCPETPAAVDVVDDAPLQKILCPNGGMCAADRAHPTPGSLPSRALDGRPGALGVPLLSPETPAAVVSPPHAISTGRAAGPGRSGARPCGCPGEPGGEPS